MPGKMEVRKCFSRSFDAAYSRGADGTFSGFDGYRRIPRQLEKQKDGPRPHGYAMTNANRNVREERLQVMLLAEEIHAIDDFRFANRMPSRAAAIRELLRRGIAAEGFSIAAPGSRSSDYGVTGEPPGGSKLHTNGSSNKFE